MDRVADQDVYKRVNGANSKFGRGLVRGLETTGHVGEILRIIHMLRWAFPQSNFLCILQILLDTHYFTMIYPILFIILNYWALFI